MPEANEEEVDYYEEEEEEEVSLPANAEALRRAGFNERDLQRVLNSVELMRDVSRMFGDLAREAEQKGATEIDEGEAQSRLDAIGERYGWHHGIPLPPLHDNYRELILPPGSVLAALGWAQRQARAEDIGYRVLHQGLSYKVRNEWTVPGDKTVEVVETEKGPMALWRWNAGARMRKIIETLLTRTDVHLRAEAEIRAMDSLKNKITAPQWNSYILNGAFPERSPRSDIYYVFRKGFPTLAVSWHGPNKEGKCLAALCMHPLGYYEGTFCGLMTPSDEVIAHLLMMRADEHKFWAKSGQWKAGDVRSGI